MTLRDVTSIVATTDFHSSLDAAPALLAHLEDARMTSLIVDCGDFFEGTGYYHLGGGVPETRILDTFYDVLAPGNHGWSHYLSPLLRSFTVCANVVDKINTVFSPYFVTMIGSRKVGITGVIGTEAFATIPPSERAGQTVLDPAEALNALNPHRAESWVLLSHAGFDHDVALAEACPWIDVIFSGHCHSAKAEPALVGKTLVIKAAEYGRGVAAAHPGYRSWSGEVSAVIADVQPETRRSVEICQEVGVLTAKLAEPCGEVSSPWAGSSLDRDLLAPHIALAAYEATRADASLINHTALRDRDLGTALTMGDLAAVEPFNATVVALRFPKPQSLAQLAGRIEPFVGPLAIAPNPACETVTSLATTSYIADTFLPEFANRTPGAPLSELVTRVLCDRPGGASA